MVASSELAVAPLGRHATTGPDLRRYLVPGLLATLAAAALIALGALVAWDGLHAGRILSGVRVGATDLSGLDPASARAALAAAYAGYGEGRLLIRTEAGEVAIDYATVGRRPDTDGMVARAMAAGRTRTSVWRAVDEVAIGIRGRALEPRVTLDAASLREAIAAGLSALETAPVDATIAIDAGGVRTTHGRDGRTFDVAAAQDAALALLREVDAPGEVVVEAASVPVAPRIGDEAVGAARAAAERMAADVVVTDGDATWTIPVGTVRGWIRFAETGEQVRAYVDAPAIPAALAGIAADVDTAPVDATFLVSRSGTTVGVRAGRSGRALDALATSWSIATAVTRRVAGGAPSSPVAAAVVAVEPGLTTEEATKVAPLMTRLGWWRTWFPVGERNHWGANIWLPAKFINGTVLQPGQRFEWWRAVGPVTRARGFGLGGYIAGDHTEPTGAMGGGMCSSSTTLFNAALRAGLQMGARSNHKYVISRYPLGLDATVSASQTMSFTNDMATPVFIRGYGYTDAKGRGWVRYEIWGIPDGRTVTIGRPVIRNRIEATTRIVEVTTRPAGEREQTEYPADGMDVSVTRVVRDSAGGVIHRETWRSHYTLWNGRIEVGVGPS